MNRNTNLLSIPFELKRKQACNEKNPWKNPTMPLTKLRYISPEMNYQVFHLTSADNITEKQLFSRFSWHLAFRIAHKTEVNFLYYYYFIIIDF